MSTQIIELDCKPGDPRPGDLIEDLIDGLGLPCREDVSRFFGEWAWDYSDLAKDVWDKATPILIKRIRILYLRGLIRFGSCG